MPYKDKDQERERQREFYRLNKEKVAKRILKYRKNNPEKAKEIEKKFQNSETRKSYLAEYQELNKDKYQQYRRAYHLKHKYGITQQQYNEMLAQQNNNCALCGGSLAAEKKICIDHCHTSRKIRGLIHHKCNVLLGYAGDKIEMLQKAINYLTK